MKEQDKTDQPSIEVRTKSRLLRIPESLASLTMADIQGLIYELAVHQMELEAQNEELRRADQTVHKERTRYHELFMSAPVGYITLDHDSRILEINNAALKLFQMKPYRRDLLINQPFTNLILPADLWRYYKYTLEASSAPAPAEFSLRLLRSGGESFWADADISFSMADIESPERYRLTLIDSTKRRQVADQEEDLNKSLNRLTAELTAANREIVSVTRSIAHELQESIAAVKDAATQLEKARAIQGDRVLRSLVVRQQRAAEAIAGRLDDLLELSRSGHAPFQHVRIDLTRLVTAIIDDLRKGDPQRKISVTIADGLTDRGDPRLIEMVFATLLSNAWHSTQTGALDHIEVGMQAQPSGRPVFFVRDNGLGFDMKEADQLFKPFEKPPNADGSADDSFDLAVTARIIRRHGGAIWAESEPGKGATFYFTLSSPREQ